MRKLAWLFAGILASGAVMAQDEESPHSFSGQMWVVSDYVFRGVSQTQEDPAFQATLNYGHSSGFYAGVWGSSVDFVPDDAPADAEDDADIEIDYYVGWGFGITDSLSADLSLVYYMYPGTVDGVDYDYAEFIGKLTAFEWLTFTLGYSNDVFNSSETGVYYGASGEWGLPAEFVLAANVGYYDLDDVFDDGYMDYGIGVSRAIGHFEIGLSYYGTDSSGDDIYGSIADDRAVLSVSLSLP